VACGSGRSYCGVLVRIFLWGGAEMTFLIQYIQQILTWLLTFIDWILIEVFQVLCTAVLAVIDAIPVPSFFTNASGYMAALPAGVVFFAQAANIGTGLTILMSAIGLRFLIRRLPFVG
jgi:thiamine transporter ThiT